MGVFRRKTEVKMKPKAISFGLQAALLTISVQEALTVLLRLGLHDSEVVEQSAKWSMIPAGL